ncbi:MAG: lysylphosphatidylglycerol synthase transmembrane domain-containing protein [Candidatus Peribacteraceae bacterium]|jgi:hypothetical protein
MPSRLRTSAILVGAAKGIGVLLFGVILLRLDAAQAAAVLASVPSAVLLAALGLFPAMYLLRSLRWHILSNIAPEPIPFNESVRVYCASLFLGIVTPGKMGETFKIPVLVAKGLSAKTSVLLTVLDRLLDIACIGTLGILAAGILFSWKTTAALGICTILFGILAGFTVRTRAARESAAVRHWLRHMPQVLLLTLLSWSLYFLQLLVLAKGFDLAVPMIPFLAIMTMTGILSLVPIAPAGLGTREAALLVFFTPYGVTPERTIAFSFSIFLLTIVGSLIGAYYWLRRPYSPPTHAAPQRH